MRRTQFLPLHKKLFWECNKSNNSGTTCQLVASPQFGLNLTDFTLQLLLPSTSRVRIYFTHLYSLTTDWFSDQICVLEYSVYEYDLSSTAWLITGLISKKKKKKKSGWFKINKQKRTKKQNPNSFRQVSSSLGFNPQSSLFVVWAQSNIWSHIEASTDKGNWSWLEILAA